MAVAHSVRVDVALARIKIGGRISDVKKKGKDENECN